MPTELLNATEVAKEFLTKAGHIFAKIEEAKFDSTKEEWRLLFDVGIAREKRKTVIVSAKTGQVVAVE